MAGKHDHLQGLTLQDLLWETRTSTRPAQYIRANPPTPRPRQTSLHVPEPKKDDLSASFRTSFTKANSSPDPFVFSAGYEMAREQEPARNPLMPSQAKVASTTSGDSKAPIEITSSPTADNVESQTFPTQPEFGRPTPLNISVSPIAKQSTKTSDGKPVIRRSGDGSYSSLFAKKRTGDVGYHKPPGLGNPLSNLGRVSPEQLQNRQKDSKSTGSAHSTSNEGLAFTAGSSQIAVPHPLLKPREDAFIFSRPVQMPLIPHHPPTGPQIFSSGFNTNPYLQPASNFVDLTKSSARPANDEVFNDSHVFENDRFGTTDPMLYIDSKQADEDIKALLEGAMNEENDKPRTRTKKRLLDQKVDQLSKKMQVVNVKTEAEHQVDEEEEEEEEDDGSRDGLKVKLLPHQIDGVEWMRNKELGTKKVRGILPKGGILADDMGLGKTIQSIALILSNPRPSADELAKSKSKSKIDPSTDRATLVVAPLALIKQWQAEIRDRVEESHSLEVRVHHGPQRTKSYKDLRKYDVVITTYQTLSSEHTDGHSSNKSALFGVNWYRVILDEAHSIKNRNAKTTKAAYDLNCQYRWCLTGTPMQNNLDELQSLIRFLRIKPYDQLDVWREQITKPMNNGRGGLSIRRLRAFLSAFMKRRTKDVLKLDGALKTGTSGAEQSNSGFKIVKRTVEKVEAEFNAQERAFYQRLQDRTDKSLERMMMGGSQMSYASALVLLMRLRQACNHPQLLGADLSKEQDALAGSRTPGRKANKDSDVDDIANMFGGLSMHTKLCDICQIELSKDAIETSLLRCTECEEDLRLAQLSAISSKAKKERKTVKRERKTNRRIVTDSDDEEEVINESETEDEDKFEDSTSSEETSDQEHNSNLGDRSHRASPASSTKIRHLLKILKHDSHAHKYIVFSFFTSMLDLIEPFLHRHNLKFVRYDGAMRNDAREASLDQLRNNPNVRILLCSLRAGSLGLNLTAASRVVILEPFWNPFVEEQAIDRVHRLNQTQDVVVHKLTISDSVEERILELQEKKREMANATIEGQKGLGAGKLTVAEMMKLFKHDAETDAKLDMIGMKDGRSLLDRDGESTLDSRPFNGYQGDAARVQSRFAKPVKRAEDPVYGRRW